MEGFMGIALIIIGIIIIVESVWEIRDRKSSLGLISDWLWFLAFNRDKQPVLSWMLIIIQITIGIGLIVVSSSVKCTVSCVPLFATDRNDREYRCDTLCMTRQ